MDSVIKDRIEKIEEGIVPEGYKKTKVGIIPEEWEVKKLGEVSKIFDGVHQTPKYKDKGIPFVSVENIRNIQGTEKYISEEDYFRDYIGRNKKVEKNDIFMTRIGSIGVPYLIEEEVDLAYYVTLALIKINDKNLNSRFIYHNIQSKYFKSELFRKTLHVAYPIKINLGEINLLRFVVPPLQEQEKIADILSTWDKAIETIEKLIKEKEKQKKGLMQELLTGKTRLPGFTGEWEEVKLGDITKNYGGRPLEKHVVEESKYKMVSIGNYSTDGKYIDNGQRIELNKETKTKLLNKSDLVMVLNDKTKDGNIIGSTILIDESNKYIYNQRSERIVIKKEVLPRYLWNLLNFSIIKREIYKLSQGGTQIYVNYKTVKEIKLNLPPLPEQKAIAEILSTADKEIELLNKLLENKKEEKKGLMQLLLTGIVRV